MQADSDGRASQELLRVGQVAALFNVHPNTVRRWSKQGILKGFRVGPRGDRRFRREDVERLMRPDEIVLRDEELHSSETQYY